MDEADIDNNCIRLGRGQTNYNHEGNRKFRDIVAARVDAYRTSLSKPQKTKIVNEVKDQIIDAGMKFIELKDGVWTPLTNPEDIRKKVGHRFRDKIEADKKAMNISEVEANGAAAKLKFGPCAVNSGREFMRTRPPSWQETANHGVACNAFVGNHHHPSLMRPASGAMTRLPNSGLEAAALSSYYANLVAAARGYPSRPAPPPPRTSNLLQHDANNNTVPGFPPGVANKVFQDTMRALQAANLPGTMGHHRQSQQLHNNKRRAVPSTEALFGGSNLPRFPNNLPVPENVQSRFPTVGVGDEAMSKILGEVDYLVVVVKNKKRRCPGD